MTPEGRALGVGAILASTLFEAVGQLAFKRAADGHHSTATGPFAAIVRNWRWILFGYGGFIADGVLWSVALYYLDISVAHPIGSVVFVVVALVSRVLLHEKLPPRRWAGIGLILVGSVLVALN